MELVVASNNRGKIEEIKAILAPFFSSIISLKEAGVDIDPEETGSTFLENALIKARAGFRATNRPVLSDDSGIVVDYLNGAPGIYSARYAGAHSNDRENNELLLKNLQNAPNRTARFFCAAVLMFSENDYIFAEGVAEGEILFAPLGDNGFGYDPLFYSYELKLPFAQASADEKNSVSHRKKALIKLVEQLNARNN